MKGKSDIVFLVILGWLIGSATFYVFFVGFILSINSYLAIACWVIVLLLKIWMPRTGKYGTAILLIGGTFNILNFGVGKTAFSVGVSGFELSGMDPLIFCLLIVYCIVHRERIQKLLLSFFKGNDEERKAEQQKKIDFYHKKFTDLDAAEFEAIYLNLKQYPDEAQIALLRIYAQKQD